MEEVQSYFEMRMENEKFPGPVNVRDIKPIYFTPTDDKSDTSHKIEDVVLDKPREWNLVCEPEVTIDAIREINRFSPLVIFVASGKAARKVMANPQAFKDDIILFFRGNPQKAHPGNELDELYEEFRNTVGKFCRVIYFYN